MVMTAEEHDRLVAVTSHLPQLISTALASVIGATPDAAKVAGPAAVDLTRLALSPYEIWRDIFATNADSVDAAAGCVHREAGRIASGSTQPGNGAGVRGSGSRRESAPPMKRNILRAWEAFGDSTTAGASVRLTLADGSSEAIGESSRRRR